MNERFVAIWKNLITWVTCLVILFSLRVSCPAAQYNVYYGHLHNHSNVSDGIGSPSYAYDYARNVAGLDFFSLADHAELMSSTEWTNMKNAAEAYNQDGVFVTFWGFEWSSSLNYGHVTVINTPDYCTSIALGTNTLDELVTWLSTREGIAFFNHPGRGDYLNREFNHFSSNPSEKFVGMELFNKADDFPVYYYNDGYYTNDGNKGFYDEALMHGWDIGASGSGDNHSGTWGTATDYRMAVLAEAKTRAAIYDAIKARRFFSTLDKNISMSFEIDGRQMGSVVDAGNSNCVIQAADGNSEIFTNIQLIKNGSAIQTWYPNQSAPVITHNLISISGEYYYIKVTQVDGDEAISSPITIIAGSGDLLPPTPNPMTWSALPQATGSSSFPCATGSPSSPMTSATCSPSISMTATTASDPDGVEYYFTCISGGGHDSGWQDSPSYEDTGLNPATTYSYTVVARDKSLNQNETTPSTEAFATTTDPVPASDSAPAWTRLTCDDFESGWGNYTDGGADCSLYNKTTHAPQGKNAADIQDNSGVASSFYYTKGIDVHTPGYTRIKIEFWFKAISMENSEYFLVQFHDGSIWHTVATYVSGADFVNKVCYQKTVLINENSYNFPTNMKIRFMCDASGGTDDVYIDEIRVSAIE